MDHEQALVSIFKILDSRIKEAANKLTETGMRMGQALETAQQEMTGRDLAALSKAGARLDALAGLWLDLTGESHPSMKTPLSNADERWLVEHVRVDGQIVAVTIGLHDLGRPELVVAGLQPSFLPLARHVLNHVGKLSLVEPLVIGREYPAGIPSSTLRVKAVEEVDLPSMKCKAIKLRPSMQYASKLRDLLEATA